MEQNHGPIQMTPGAHIDDPDCPHCHPDEDTVGALDSEKHCPTCHSDNMWAHGKPCYYCGKPVNNLAGNPSEWNLFLPHADDPGRIKPHHVGCVERRLHYLEDLLSHVEEIKDVLKVGVGRGGNSVPDQTIYPPSIWGRIHKFWSESRG